jgi:hypothetical protein
VNKPELVEALKSAQKRLAATNAVVGKMRVIHALWLAAHATPATIENSAKEFYFTIGDLFGGVPTEKLLANLKIVDADEVRRELEEEP